MQDKIRQSTDTGPASQLAARILDASLATAASSPSAVYENVEPLRDFAAVAEKAPDRLELTLVMTAWSLAHSAEYTANNVADLVVAKVTESVARYDFRAPDLFADVERFVKEKQKSGVRLPVEAFAGIWLLCNLKGADPTPNEMRESALMGLALTRMAHERMDQESAKQRYSNTLTCWPKAAETNNAATRKEKGTFVVGLLLAFGFLLLFFALNR